MTMKRKEVVGELLVYSTIYDEELPTKVLEEMASEQLHLDPEQNYHVDILFASSVYEREEFYSFTVSKPSPVLRGRKKLSEHEIKKEKMYDILSEQRDNVTKALEAAGINVWSSSIIGEERQVSFFVEIIFYSLVPEPEVKGKRKSTEAHVNCVMPSREAFYKNLEKACEIIEEARARRLKEEEKEKEQREQHIPNWFLAEELFSEIAQSMYPSDYDKAILHKEMLYKTEIQVSDWPLQIKSGVKTKDDAFIDKDTRLDCPEYMIYTQYASGKWSIEKTESLKTAQATIVRHGYNLKSIDRIVVLHHLKSVPYTLFKETDEGLVMITPEEAQGQKKLYLSWNK